MEINEQGILFMVGIGFVIIRLVYVHWSDKKRKEAMKEVAKQLNMQYEEQANRDYGRGPSELFRIFGRTRNYAIKNRISGEAAGMSMWLFDYHQTVGSGKSKNVHVHTVLMLRAAVRLAQFNLRPEGVLDKIGHSIMGEQDIDFDDYPGFSAKFELQGEDEAAIRNLFEPRVIQKIDQGATNVSIASNGGEFLFFKHRTAVEPEVTAVKAFLEEGIGYFNSLAENSAE